MNFYIVTPSYNSSDTINRTISSVISQSGDFRINYHIQDGGSTDGTVYLLEKWKKIIEEKLIPISCQEIKFTYSSEIDSGMYNAIQKGFSKLNFENTDWITWINSDDILLPDSLSLICNIENASSEKGKINWVTGQPAILNSGSYIRFQDRMLNSDIIGKGLSDGISAPFVQQEGTFFRGFLWTKFNNKALDNFSYAGDWSLWKHFASEEEIYYSDSPLGVFTSRPDQISKKFWNRYVSEIIESNSYNTKISHSPYYFRIIPKQHDGTVIIEKRKTNIKLNSEDSNTDEKRLYESIKKLIATTELKLSINCKRTFILGYSGLAKHIYNILQNNNKKPDAFLVSEEKLTNLNECLVKTITEAAPAKDDLIIVASFRNGNMETIFKNNNIESDLVHWTELF